MGDVHGRADLLAEKFAAIDADLAARPAASHVEILLGDYVDRGPRARDVIGLILARRRGGCLEALAGNHEELFLRFLDGDLTLQHWREMGGAETLLSYGLAAPRLFHSLDEEISFTRRCQEAVPADHVTFLRTLPTHREVGDYFFVHAGVRPQAPLAEQSLEDLLWIRNEFLDWSGGFGRIVVHGHTPVGRPEVRSNRINLDTGAYITGVLTCLVLEGSRLHFL
ncbi:serine/threonine protein phosphatase [Alsobacter soli]|uniref:Serine/threonine protein phosphatase n=2 Tax=Alsobacter soli TaxID=2109933 RepID=A0A2T1HNA8_9HYPH|nr:serine/threonine protein phosphatase [Alsobacter soli]